jgi:hypothetical protein
LGTNQRVYLICWEGATASRGVSFVQELESSPALSSSSSVHITDVLPLPELSHAPSIRASTILLPFSEPYERLIEDYENDDIILEALESISGLTYREESLVASIPTSFSPRKSFSHREKSIRLLRQCSSWTQLENTRDNRLLLERQGTCDSSG